MADAPNVQQAVSELAKMARFAEAFRDAQIVLDALGASEQLKAELDSAIAARRVDLDQAISDLAAAQAAAETARVVGQDATNAARAAAAAAVDAADRQVAATNAAGQEQAAQAQEALAAVQKELADAQAALVAVNADLDDQNAKLAAAKHAARILLA